MSRKNLPPLEVGTIYRARDFEGFEYTSQPLQKAVIGEDTAILRLKLSNATIIEIPADTHELHYLLRTLMEAYPVVAIEHAKQRGWV